MTQYGQNKAGSFRYRRPEHQKQSFFSVMLVFMVSIILPLAVQAEGEPNALCTGCHNEDGNSVTPEFPKLAGLDAVYIAKQIKDFKNDKRVSEIMGPMANQIPDKDIGLLASYFSKQKRSVGIVTDQQLAAQGQQIYDDGIVSSAVPACSGCHGEKGEGTDKFPRLAGQHTVYLITQMNNFKNAVRNNDPRKVMRAITMRMTEQDMKAAAEYITSLKGE
ncbi:c-type cytochrome [Sideroxydans sp. CL21]|uniref:c-type cytochrome n=1 Tax=Sideroxydans sp. CL21 TaxID=2600596 RepID=UPI0024BC8D72|nr:c-type cytochrome [Sideroxydans sp. CL21]